MTKSNGFYIIRGVFPLGLPQSRHLSGHLIFDFFTTTTQRALLIGILITNLANNLLMCRNELAALITHEPAGFGPGAITLWLMSFLVIDGRTWIGAFCTFF